MVFRLSGAVKSLPAEKFCFNFACSSAMFCCSRWMPRNCLYLSSSLQYKHNFDQRRISGFESLTFITLKERNDTEKNMATTFHTDDVS